MQLKYTPLEALSVKRPVPRIPYIAENCRARGVLDLGCFDETALIKRGTSYWLHAAIASVARQVTGLDNSSKIPAGGIKTGNNSHIERFDVLKIDRFKFRPADVDVIIAGELIEHLPHTLEFFKRIKAVFSGKHLICSTPNAISLTNGLLALLLRESSHADHLQLYSFKTLNTLAARAGFEQWEIVPYYVCYGEMLLRSRGLKRLAVQSIQSGVNLMEYAFPLLSGGLILNVSRI